MWSYKYVRALGITLASVGAVLSRGALATSPSAFVGNDPSTVFHTDVQGTTLMIEGKNLAKGKLTPNVFLGDVKLALISFADSYIAASLGPLASGTYLLTVDCTWDPNNSTS